MKGLYKGIVKKIRRLKNNLVLWVRRLPNYLWINTSDKFPRIQLHEKYESFIKWTLRGLTFFGIASSLIALPGLGGFLLAIVLFTIEQILERVVFVFNTLFILPMPLSYQPEDWKGAVWGAPAPPNDEPFLVGLLFKDEETAKELFECIKSWNYYKVEDNENNICLSIIKEDNDQFSFYIYPNVIDRRSIKDWDKQHENLDGKVHKSIVMSAIFCKKFDYSNSGFIKFEEKYQAGKLFLLKAYYLKDNIPVEVSPYDFISKSSIKIKPRQDLKQSELEYEHGRFTMDLN